MSERTTIPCTLITDELEAIDHAAWRLRSVGLALELLSDDVAGHLPPTSRPTQTHSTALGRSEAPMDASGVYYLLVACIETYTAQIEAAHQRLHHAAHQGRHPSPTQHQTQEGRG